MGNIITYTLSANPNYFNSRPYIDTIKFKFYKTNNDALVAFKKGEVDALSTLSPEEAENIDKSNLHYLNTTKDFILFFNVESTILKDKRVREALAKSFNIEKFSKEVLRDSGITFQNFSDYDIDYAKTLLNKAGWKEINSDGIRIKSSGKNKIKFSLTLFVPSGEIHRKTAEFLKNTWREIGLELNISILDPAEISSIVRSRSYDMILFGAIFGPEQDLFPLWHSSHSRYPGLNLSQFKNKNLDKILETLRKEPDVNKRNTLRQQANNIIQENFPGIILYSQYYIYALSPKIHADSYLPKIIVSPEERFLNINKWFIITKRKWVGLGR
jgi:peptide/nickel transport system substrate-binding protein